METAFLLIVLLSYLGLLTGSIISYFTAEEITIGKEYLKSLKSLILLLMLFLFFIQLNMNNIIAFTLSAALVLFFFFFGSRLKYIHEDTIIYAFFAIFLYETKDIAPLYPVLIFIYGIPVASLSYIEKHGSFFRRISSIMADNILYPVLSLANLIAFRN